MESLVSICTSPYEAVAGAHAILFLTEWDAFKSLDFVQLYASMVKPAFLFDGRVMLEHDKLREIGFRVHCVGMKSPRVGLNRSAAAGDFQGM